MMVTEYEIEFEGLPVHVWRGGTGTPLLMLHGSGPGASTIGNWGLVLEPLAERFHILAADLIGFGLSGRKPSPPYFDLPLWVRQAERLVRELPEGPVGVLGHSVSGALALKLAARDSRVAAVMTTGTMGLPFPVNEDVRAVWSFPRDRNELERAARALFFDGRHITEEFILNRLKVLHSGDYGTYFSEMFSGDLERYVQDAVLADDEIARIKVPVLLVHGRQDRFCPLEKTSAALARKLPQAELLVLENCGHSPAREYPDKVIEATGRIFRHVRSHETQHSTP